MYVQKRTIDDVTIKKNHPPSIKRLREKKKGPEVILCDIHTNNQPSTLPPPPPLHSHSKTLKGLSERTSKNFYNYFLNPKVPKFQAIKVPRALVNKLQVMIAGFLGKWSKFIKCQILIFFGGGDWGSLQTPM